MPATERAQAARSGSAVDRDVREPRRRGERCSRRSRRRWQGGRAPLLQRGATVLVPNPEARYLHLTGNDPQRIGAARVGVRAGARGCDRVGAAPILATSANLHGGADPRTLGEVPAELAAQCAVLVDGGPASAGRASTVLDLSAARPVILREGALATADALALIA